MEPSIDSKKQLLDYIYNNWRKNARINGSVSRCWRRPVSGFLLILEYFGTVATTPLSYKAKATTNH